MSKYHEYDKAGRCTNCGGERLPGLKLCERCRQYRISYNAALRNSRKDIGLCPLCGEPRDQDTALCSKCLKYYRHYYKIRRNDLIENGLCFCGKPLAPGRRSCSACLDRQRKNSKQQRAARKNRREGQS